MQRLVGRIPRFPGFKYGAKIKAIPYNGTFLFRVEQKGFWMDSSIVGPAKLTSDEAVKAWKRLFRARFYPPNSADSTIGGLSSPSNPAEGEKGR